MTIGLPACLLSGTFQPNLLTTLSLNRNVTTKNNIYPVIYHAGEAPIMSSKPNLHVKFCVVTRKALTAFRVNLPDVEELSLEVKPPMDHLSLPHCPVTDVLAVVTRHQLHSLLLLAPDVALEQLVGDEEGGETPDKETGAQHHPPPAGQHNTASPYANILRRMLIFDLE